MLETTTKIIVRIGIETGPAQFTTVVMPLQIRTLETMKKFILKFILRIGRGIGTKIIPKIGIRFGLRHTRQPIPRIG